MITRNDIIDAITMCVGYDPVHAPKQSKIIEDAWAQHFASSACAGLGRPDLVAAVDAYYRTPRQPWPQPADISSLARSEKRDAYDRQSPDTRAANVLKNARHDKYGYIDKSAPDLPDPPLEHTSKQRVDAYWAAIDARARHDAGMP